jgi:hypothetical protein
MSWFGKGIALLSPVKIEVFEKVRYWSNTAVHPVLGGLSDKVFAPRQQREQLDPEIGNHEGCECDRRYSQKRIFNERRHEGVNRVEYDDVRQIHAIAHARKIVDDPP